MNTLALGITIVVLIVLVAVSRYIGLKYNGS